MKGCQGHNVTDFPPFSTVYFFFQLAVVISLFPSPLCTALFTLHLSPRLIVLVASPCDPEAPACVCSATLVIITAEKAHIDHAHIHAGADAA